MATLYRRTAHYCFVNKKKPLSSEQQQELGRIVCDKFIEIKDPKDPIRKATFTTLQGTFTVIAYPKTFVPEIDRLISEFYSKLPKRKRIPVREFSSRQNKTSHG